MQTAQFPRQTDASLNCLPTGIESLEPRRLLTALLDPALQPKFVNPVANPLDPSFIFQPSTTGGTHYEIGVEQTTQSLGLVDPVTGAALLTKVWGYGNAAQATTYPGRTLVAQQGTPVTVRWTNNLVDPSGNPLPHLLPVDSTLHWADPLDAGHVPGPYTGPVPIVSHLHGGHTRSDSDGLPDAWFTPNFEYTGRLFNEVYTYDNDQEAATLWYHDHALGITRLNVYAGLAGFFILRDAWDTGVPDNPATPANENPSNLPTGAYEIPLVIQDRMFTADGQLFYPSEPEMGGDHAMLEDGTSVTALPREVAGPTAQLPLPAEHEEVPNPTVLPEFFGDHILVNGTAWPYMDVEPRQYRLRLLNGSDSRFYNLRVGAGAGAMQAGPQVIQIGSDGGLLNAPVYLDQLLLGPGERADVIVDFSGFAGQTLTVRNNARGPFPKGETLDPSMVGQIMQFRVGTTVNEPDLPVPATLRPAPIEPLIATAPKRGLLLFEGEDRFGRLQPMLGIVDPTNPANGTLLWDDAITENPALNAVEVWEIYNSTADAHPIHLHLTQFQVLGRQKFRGTLAEKEMMQDSTGGVLTNVRVLGRQQPPEFNEQGWKDTVIMNPGEVTRVIAKFDRPGEYVWHCHILSHEDHEMMRSYFVGTMPVNATARPESSLARLEMVQIARPVFGNGPIMRMGENVLEESTPGDLI